MAKIIAVEAQAAPRMAQTSATSAARAPSPPRSIGINMPMSLYLLSAAKASAGKRDLASTSAAWAAAILATASARAINAPSCPGSDERARRSEENKLTVADIFTNSQILPQCAEPGEVFAPTKPPASISKALARENPRD